MRIMQDPKSVKTLKLYSYGMIVACFIFAGLDIWLYLNGTHPAILIPPALLLLSLIFCRFFFQNHFAAEYSVDATGIKTYFGKKVSKNIPWHTFSYVGELDVAYSVSQIRGLKMIVCSPEPPKPALGKPDCFTFPQKSSVWMDYSPENEQIMRPYYRGSVSAE